MLHRIAAALAGFLAGWVVLGNLLWSPNLNWAVISIVAIAAVVAAVLPWGEVRHA